MMNQTILIGRLVKDPDMKMTQGGTAVTRFTLAVDRGLSKEKKQEMESKGQPTADFIPITVWGKQAENCANYLAKGRLVAVQGCIQTGSYDDKDGKRVYTTEVIAREVKFLSYDNDNTQRQQNPEPQFERAESDLFPF